MQIRVKQVQGTEQPWALWVFWKTLKATPVVMAIAVIIIFITSWGKAPSIAYLGISINIGLACMAVALIFLAIHGFEVFFPAKEEKQEALALPADPKLWTHDEQPEEEDGLPKTVLELLRNYFGFPETADLGVSPVENSRDIDWAKRNLKALKRVLAGQYVPIGLAYDIQQMTPIQFMERYFGVLIDSIKVKGEYQLWYRGLPSNMDYLCPGKFQENLESLEKALDQVPSHLKDAVS